MPPVGPRLRSATIGIPLGCLLVLAIVVPEFGGVLIPTMGIVVVAAALFLNPRETMIVAGAAVLTAVAVASSSSASSARKSSKLLPTCFLLMAQPLSRRDGLPLDTVCRY